MAGRTGSPPCGALSGLDWQISKAARVFGNNMTESRWLQKPVLPNRCDGLGNTNGPSLFSPCGTSPLAVSISGCSNRWLVVISGFDLTSEPILQPLPYCNLCGLGFLQDDQLEKRRCSLDTPAPPRCYRCGLQRDQVSSLSQCPGLFQCSAV